jgi:transcriptional regulator with XRE-family HTH domain
MRFGERIVSWRMARRVAPDELARRAGIDSARLDAIERGDEDPTASILASLASGLGVPPGWLHDDPKRLLALTADDDEGSASPDPVTERILAASHMERTLFALVAQLVSAAEPRLVRAAEVSLLSLVKQIPRTTVPWESRPPGHFEPPSD